MNATHTHFIRIAIGACALGVIALGAKTLAQVAPQSRWSCDVCESREKLYVCSGCRRDGGQASSAASQQRSSAGFSYSTTSQGRSSVARSEPGEQMRVSVTPDYGRAGDRVTIEYVVPAGREAWLSTEYSGLGPEGEALLVQGNGTVMWTVPDVHASVHRTEISLIANNPVVLSVVARAEFRICHPGSACPPTSGSQGSSMMSQGRSSIARSEPGEQMRVSVTPSYGRAGDRVTIEYVVPAGREVSLNTPFSGLGPDNEGLFVQGNGMVTWSVPDVPPSAAGHLFEIYLMVEGESERYVAAYADFYFCEPDAACPPVVLRSSAGTSSRTSQTTRSDQPLPPEIIRPSAPESPSADWPFQPGNPAWDAPMTPVDARGTFSSAPMARSQDFICQQITYDCINTEQCIGRLGYQAGCYRNIECTVRPSPLPIFPNHCIQYCAQEWACDPGQECVATQQGGECRDRNTSVCGNGISERNEQCDDGNASNADECLNTCVYATCGDGFVRDTFEECDDGNRQNGDGCTAACETEGGGGDGGSDGGSGGNTGGDDGGDSGGGDGGETGGGEGEQCDPAECNQSGCSECPAEGGGTRVCTSSFCQADRCVTVQTTRACPTIDPRPTCRTDMRTFQECTGQGGVCVLAGPGVAVATWVCALPKTSDLCGPPNDIACQQSGNGSQGRHCIDFDANRIYQSVPPGVTLSGDLCVIKYFASSSSSSGFPPRSSASSAPWGASSARSVPKREDFSYPSAPVYYPVQPPAESDPLAVTPTQDMPQLGVPSSSLKKRVQETIQRFIQGW